MDDAARDGIQNEPHRLRVQPCRINASSDSRVSSSLATTFEACMYAAPPGAKLEVIGS
jgi:hypothetical protein